MKRYGIGILLIATMVFGSLYLQQTRKARQAQANADDLQENLDAQRADFNQQQTQAERLANQLEQARADTAAKGREAARLRKRLEQNLTNQSAAQLNVPAPAAHSPKAANPLAQMFNNPEMKEMILKQQKPVLSAMLDKNYGRLFSDLQLTPDQKATLKDLILNKQMGAAQAGLSMFSNEQDATQRAESIQQMKTANDAADAQIRQFLGDDNFQQYQAYEKTMVERMAVSGFKDQLSGGPSALTDEQEQQLVQGMFQQRENFRFTTDLSDKSKLTGGFATQFTEEKINTYMEELGQLNQQYLSRAQGILQPEQAAAFEQYLKNQQAMQKAGMQMAVKMFSPGKAGGE